MKKNYKCISLRSVFLRRLKRTFAIPFLLANMYCEMKRGEEAATNETKAESFFQSFVLKDENDLCLKAREMQSCLLEIAQISTKIT
jgi:hypothetical protein